MKKKNLKSLQLNKKAISNLKKLKGGEYDETFIALCITIFIGDCVGTLNCETQGRCGETIGVFCGLPTYEGDSCPC